ncbi:MAG: coproporphyrinogen dehydrogenase HemZ [Clostridia bacterium]|nr:coproporphyrinogen dehydrogenase HemZ [Clostridia bacterium]
MLIICPADTYKYECEKICRVFFPTAKFDVTVGADPGGEGMRTFADETEKDVTFSCRLTLGGKEIAREESFSKNTFSMPREMALARVMFDALSEYTGVTPPWGVLTGVRPSKLMRALIRERGESAAKEIFLRDYKVRADKTDLAFSVAKAEDAGVALSRPESFSLYVSIPFCPTRCAYCSFVSHSIASAKKLIPDYVKLLSEELRAAAVLAKELGLRLETVYFGGGTPTSLSAEDLTAITDTIRASFDLSDLREYTVEAGRPDTVDREKLTALKNAGVTRISINPQTFENGVLEAVGRRHTAEETIEKYKLARNLGFDDINMDFIAGLPTDTPAGFRRSIETAIALAPENITVHTLALKTAARLVTEKADTDNGGVTADMVECANALLPAAGYRPYYMYRQSKTLGNLENVGWTKPGADCLYNIYMMEEVHTVLAAGAGAVTKLKDPYSDLLTRVYNFKYPYEYVSRFGEMLERKDEVRRFYESVKR